MPVDMTHNPFRFNLPTRPEDFVGRRELVAQIANDLCLLNGDSYSIVGGRRCGKSSLLAALDDVLTQRLANSQMGNLIVLPVNLSLQQVKQLESPQDFFGLALHKLRIAARGAKKRQGLLKDGRLVDLNLPAYEATEPVAANIYDLEAEIASVVTVAADLLGDMRVVLLVDEIDRALDYPWTESVFDNLRSMVYDGNVCNVTRLVITGSGRYMQLTQKGSALINMLTKFSLEPLPQTAMQELVQRASGLPTDVAEELLRLVGGHPYVAQFILHHLFIGGCATAKLTSIGDETNRFLYSCSDDLDRWWYGLGEDGRFVGCVLATTSNWMSLSDIIVALNDPELHADRGLKALCSHGLAEHDDSFINYRLRGELFRSWILSRCKNLKKINAGVTNHSSGVNVGQQAGNEAIQLGTVNNSTITINRPTSELTVASLHLDPQKSLRLKPIVQVLTDKFSRGEFQVLCFDLGINYDLLPEGGLEIQAVHLVLALDRAEQIASLVQEINKKRSGALPA